MVRSRHNFTCVYFVSTTVHHSLSFFLSIKNGNLVTCVKLARYTQILAVVRTQSELIKLENVHNL